MFKLFCHSVACLLLSMLGVAQAQTYPDTVSVNRADGMQIKLINKVDGPGGSKYYLYSENGVTLLCTAPQGSGNPATNKPQTMWNMAVVLGKNGNAKNINENNRTYLMKDAAGTFYRVELPTRDELIALRSVHGGLPGRWNNQCGFAGGAMLQGGPEFWSSTWYWNDHYTYDLQHDVTRGRWDTDSRAIALKVLKIDDSQVCFFEDGDFQNRYKCFGHGDVRWVGEFSSARGPYGTSANDVFSSMLVGKNCSVSLYEHGDFGGASITFSSNRAINWLGEMNDQVSSLKVTCTSSPIDPTTDARACIQKGVSITRGSQVYNWCSTVIVSPTNPGSGTCYAKSVPQTIATLANTCNAPVTATLKSNYTLPDGVNPQVTVTVPANANASATYLGDQEADVISARY